MTIDNIKSILQTPDYDFLRKNEPNTIRSHFKQFWSVFQKCECKQNVEFAYILSSI